MQTRTWTLQSLGKQKANRSLSLNRKRGPSTSLEPCSAAQRTCRTQESSLKALLAASALFNIGFLPLQSTINACLWEPSLNRLTLPIQREVGGLLSDLEPSVKPAPLTPFRPCAQELELLGRLRRGQGPSVFLSSGPSTTLG